MASKLGDVSGIVSETENVLNNLLEEFVQRGNCLRKNAHGECLTVGIA